MNQKKVLYVGNVGTIGTALTVHAQNIARLLKKIGYETHFICDGGKDTSKQYKSHPEFAYSYTTKYVKIPKLSALEWLFDEIYGWKYVSLVRVQIKMKRPDLIILYGYAGEKRLIKLCRKNKIPLILERVDWFERADRNGFFWKYILQRQVDLSIRKRDKQADGVIAISEFLTQHYKKMGQKVLFVPPIFDFETSDQIDRTDYSGNLHLVYAGSLGGNKDQVLPVLDVLRKINHNTVQISMDIVGITMKQIEALTKKNDWGNLGVQAFGRLSNDDTKKIVRRADFSLLLRQNKRYAKAGFSTKFAESMSLGVPVICTKVGGADTVIRDMIDGVQLADNELTTIQQKFEELLAKKPDEILTLKKNAFHSACGLFHTDNYIETMKNFIGEVSGVRQEHGQNV